MPFLIQKAQAYIKQYGMAQAVKEFNRLDSPFNTFSDINKNGDLYVYTTNAKGYQSVHGKNPKIPGKVMIDMRDADGVFIIKGLIEQCFSPAGKGWFNFRWPNPVTKTLENKRAYIERIPGSEFCLGTGIYR